MSIVSNIEKFVETIENFDEIQDEILSIMLLSSFPDSFVNFIVVIESRNKIPPLNFLKGKMLEEEHRQINRMPNENEEQILMNKSRYFRIQQNNRNIQSV